MREHVVMHGYVDKEEKTEILRRAAVFATPSMHEGWGLTVIEANSRGCPAVAYDVPGLRAAIRDGQTGLLAKDDSGFKRALSLLLGSAEAQHRYSVAAREWAERFDWDSCSRQTLEVLRAAGSGSRSFAREEAEMESAAR